MLLLVIIEKIDTSLITQLSELYSKRTFILFRHLLKR